MQENNKRLEVLYRNHDKWLRQVAYNICKNSDMVDDLVGELYLYLAEKINPKIYFADSFNLQYCRSFIHSRFINKIKVDNRYNDNEIEDNRIEEHYDTEFDSALETTYDDIKSFLKQKQMGKKWVSSKIAELYYFGKDKTIESLAAEIGVSKSTIFLHIKAVKNEIRETIQNPFKSGNEI